MYRLPIVTLATFFLVLAFNVAADDVNQLSSSKIMYRWVDGNGLTHFSQMKPTDSTIENIEEIPLPNSKSYKQNKQLQQEKLAQGDLLTQFADVALENCLIATQNLKILAAFKNITQENNQGEAVQLSTNEREEQLALTNKQIELFCTK